MHSHHYPPPQHARTHYGGGGEHGGGGAHGQLLQQYHDGLLRLGSFPDKHAIGRLTEQARALDAHARDVVDLMLGRVIPHAATPSKIPLFYVLDSVLKNVGGAYPSAAGPYIGPAFRETFRSVPPKDQTRLYRMLKTWAETRLFEKSQLTELFAYLGPWIAQQVQGAPQGGPQGGPPGGNPEHLVGTKRPAPLPAHNAAPAKAARPVSANVQNEMRRLLRELQEQLQEPNPVSLEELWVTNSQLALDLQANAESALLAQGGPRMRAAGARAGGLDVDLEKARELVASLQRAVTRGGGGGSTFASAAATVSNRLAQLLQKTGVKGAAAARASLPVASFSPDTIATRDGGAISRLFRLPYCCTVDGLRFETTHQLGAHEEVLKQRARERREQVHGEAARTWFCTTKEWYSDFASEPELGSAAGGHPADTTSRDVGAQGSEGEGEGAGEAGESCVVKTGEEPCECRICGEPFEMFWDDKKEEWLYRSATTVRAIDAEDPENRVVVHVACAKAVSAEDGTVQASQLLD